MSDKSYLIDNVYLTTLAILIVVFASVGSVHALFATASLAVIKQLGRINTTLTRIKGAI